MAETQQQQQNQQENQKNAAQRSTSPSANNGTTANNATGTVLGFEGLKIDPRYFISIPGILKVVEWVIAIICISCAAPALLSFAHWFLFVVVICFIGTFGWMCVHFFTIPTSIFPHFPWQLLELVYTAVATILYFIACVVMLQQSTSNKPTITIYYGNARWDSYITAGVFSLFNTLVYAAETAFHFKSFVDSRQK